MSETKPRLARVDQILELLRVYSQVDRMTIYRVYFELMRVGFQLRICGKVYARNDADDTVKTKKLR